MAFDAFTLAVIGIGAGAIFGVLNSVFGWLKNNEPFKPRSFAITVLTGLGAGVVLVFTQISGLVEAQTNYEVLYQLAMLAFAIFGVNFLRTVGSSLVANRAVEEVKSE
jgi:hypothetical protein